MPRNQPYIDPMSSGTFFFGSRCIMPFISRSGSNTNLTVDVMAVAILLAACCDVWCSLMHVSCKPSIKLTAIKQTKTKALGQFYKKNIFGKLSVCIFAWAKNKKTFPPPPPQTKKTATATITSHQRRIRGRFSKGRRPWTAWPSTPHLLATAANG